MTHIENGTRIEDEDGDTLLSFETVKVGDVVRVAEKHRTYVLGPLVNDREYTVTQVEADSSAGGKAKVGLDGDYVRWGVSWFELAQRPEAPARPTIDFSTDSRGKARQYAAEAQSPSLEEAHNVVLRQVEHRSTAVDAYALNAAVTAALSAAATRRLPNGLTRSELTSRIRHLGHIVQAVLENHADNLPAYAEGERSRKVKSLELEVRELEGRLARGEEIEESLRESVATATHELEVTTAALAEKDAVLTQLLETGADRHRMIGDLRKQLHERTQERDALAATVAYVFENVGPAQRLLFEGYLDGVADGIDSVTE